MGSRGCRGFTRFIHSQQHFWLIKWVRWVVGCGRWVSVGWRARLSSWNSALLIRTAAPGLFPRRSQSQPQWHTHTPTHPHWHPKTHARPVCRFTFKSLLALSCLRSLCPGVIFFQLFLFTLRWGYSLLIFQFIFKPHGSSFKGFIFIFFFLLFWKKKFYKRIFRNWKTGITYPKRSAD